MADNKPELQRGLEARHIELIATGGAPLASACLWGAASTLKWAGPSVLLAYIIAGLFVFFHHAFNGRNVIPRTGYRFVRRLCASLYEPVLWLSHRPGLTGLCGWRWGSREITAIGVYVQFWFPEMAQWIPALIAVALVALANLAAVRLYGEIEFWFAMIKVTTIIVMIVIGTGRDFLWLWQWRAVDWF